MYNIHVHVYCTGGDQLTVARIRGSQRIRSNSEVDIERLEGFTAMIEDWHAKVAFLGVGIHVYLLLCHMYAYQSSCTESYEYTLLFCCHMQMHSHTCTQQVNGSTFIPLTLELMEALSSNCEM